MKNTYGGVLHFVLKVTLLGGFVRFVQFKKHEKKPMEAPRVFFMFFKLYKSYQIAQSIRNTPIKRPKKYLQDRN